MLQAARELLATEGWDAVIHGRVAEKAGVGRATAYRHWPTVNELALEAASSEVEGTHAPATGDLSKDLLTELQFFRTSLVDRGLKRLMVSVMERAIHDPEFRVIRSQLNQKGGGHLRSLLRSAVKSGELRADTDIEELVSQLAGPLIYEIVLHDRAISDKRLTRLVEMVLHHRRPS
jgi:AcrR family transcriptional regulator